MDRAVLEVILDFGYINTISLLLNKINSDELKRDVEFDLVLFLSDFIHGFAINYEDYSD